MKTLLFIIALFATFALIHIAFKIPIPILCGKAFWALIGYYSHYFLTKNEPA